MRARANHFFPRSGKREQCGERGALLGRAGDRSARSPRAFRWRLSPTAASWLRACARSAARAASTATGCIKCEIDSLQRARLDAIPMLPSALRRAPASRPRCLVQSTRRATSRALRAADRSADWLLARIAACSNPTADVSGGKKRGRRVVAHAPDGFFAFQAERLKEQTELIFGPTHRRGQSLRLNSDV